MLQLHVISSVDCRTMPPEDKPDRSQSTVTRRGPEKNAVFEYFLLGRAILSDRCGINRSGPRFTGRFPKSWLLAKGGTS